MNNVYTQPTTSYQDCKPDSPLIKTTGSKVVKAEVYPIVSIIDRKTHNRFQELGISDRDAADLSSYSKNTKISDLTHWHLLELNNRFYQFWHGYTVYSPLQPSMSVRDKEHVNETVRRVYLGAPDSEAKASYEIRQVDGQKALIVVENGFLHHLTQSKEESTAFVLALLRYFDNLGVSSTTLNGFYLKLAMIPSFMDVLKTRALV
ncbi:MAG: hypothetical protein PHN51_11660 [Candidatus Nanopelagicales bacterium]|nr:hypothetical protein [Candidatus Nanopelagicales bacterium]